MKKRLFIGIDVSDEARSAAGSYIDELSDRFREIRVNWARPEKLHLTLKFLGSVDNELISSITKDLTTVADQTSKFTTKLDRTGAFPSTQKPKVLWIAIRDPFCRLEQLAQELDSRFIELGFPEENRPFKPHLTVGRVKDPGKASKLGQIHTAQGFGPIRFEVKEIVLYESIPNRLGSVYKRLAIAPLQA